MALFSHCSDQQDCANSDLPFSLPLPGRWPATGWQTCCELLLFGVAVYQCVCTLELVSRVCVCVCVCVLCVCVCVRTCSTVGHQTSLTPLPTAAERIEERVWGHAPRKFWDFTCSGASETLFGGYTGGPGQTAPVAPSPPPPLSGTASPNHFTSKSSCLVPHVHSLPL